MDVADGSPLRLAQVMVARRLVFAAVVAFVVSSVSACGGQAEPPEAAASTTSVGEPGSTSTSSAMPTESDVRLAVQAGYDAAANGFIEASKTSDPDHPLLGATHTGPMLEQRRLVLVGRRREGRASRQPPESVYRIEHENVEMVDATTARLTVCVVDDGVVYEVESGAIVNDRVETSRVTATMRMEAGVWKLAERELVEEWPGVAGCAAG